MAHLVVKVATKDIAMQTSTHKKMALFGQLNWVWLEIFQLPEPGEGLQQPKWIRCNDSICLVTTDSIQEPHSLVV